MPQLIALALIGAGVLAGYKWALAQQAARQQAARQRAADAARQGGRVEPPAPKDLGPLEVDPASGEYRPRTARS